jgi:hypothetical protein
VQAVAALPKGYGRITEIRDVQGYAVIVDDTGREIPTATSCAYLNEK